MRPVILTNAFRRPRATRFANSVSLSEETNVYACVEEMIRTISENLGAMPLMLPTLPDRETLRNLLGHIDGIFLPGAVSNIHPAHYGDSVRADIPQTFDHEHDSTDLMLTTLAIEMNIPFFGICRAMQAMNLAFGGTLTQQLPIDRPSPIDHSCSNPCDGHDENPRFMHTITTEPDGLLASLFGAGETLAVNSMHEQAVNRIGRKLRVEAMAPDGIIEAISYPSSSFHLGVQWHPEALRDHPVSQRLFAAFSEHIHARHHHRTGEMARG